MICAITKRIVPSLRIFSNPIENIENISNDQWFIYKNGNTKNCILPSNIDDIWADNYVSLLKQGETFGISERYIEGLKRNKEYYILVRLKKWEGRSILYINNKNTGSLSVSIGDEYVVIDNDLLVIEKVIVTKTDTEGKLRIIVSSTSDDLYVDIIKGSISPIIIETIDTDETYPSSTSSSSIVDIEPPSIDSSFKELIVGDNYSLALTNTGNIWSWGDGVSFGDTKKSKNGDVSITRSLPYKVLENEKITNYKQSIIDGQYSIIRLGDGFLYEYGVNPDGEFGLVATRLNNIDNTDIKNFHLNKGHGIAIKSDGTMFSFGKTFSDKSSLMSKSDISKVVISDTLHAIALASDGTVYTWGTNLYGELGNGNFSSQNTLQTLTVSSISDIWVGDYVSYILSSNGSLYSFGNNTYGELGNGNFNIKNIPSLVEINNVKKISVGKGFVIGLKSNGKVFTWGKNNYGQIGSGDTVNTNSPYMVPSLEYISDITTGNDHISVLKSDGSVYSWGKNNYGQIGDGTYSFGDSLEELPSDITGIREIEDTNIYDYYDTNNFDINRLFVDGSDVHRYTPYKVEIQDVKKLYSYDNYTIAVKYNTTAWVWGSNLYNQLSFYPKNLFKIQLYSTLDVNGNVTNIKGFYKKRDNADPSNYILPSPTDMGFTYINSVELGKQRVIFKSKNEVVATGWGFPYNNKFKLNNINDVHYPSKTLYAKSKWISQIKKLEGSKDYPYILKSDGELIYTNKFNIEYTVNDFNIIQYASNMDTYSGLTTINVDNISTGGEVIDVASFEDYFVIVRKDGTVQLGINGDVVSNIHISDGLRVYGGAYDLDVNASTFLVERTDGSLWECSSHNYETEFPININNFDDIKTITYKGKEILILNIDGTVVVGDKFDNDIKYKLPIDNIKDVSSIGYRYLDVEGNETIYSTYFLLTSNGHVYSFGNNRIGTFGNQSLFNDDRYITELILSEINNVKSLSKGGNSEHMLVIKSDNTIWGWGRNDFYQLGNGFNLNRVSPVFVGGLPSLRLVNTGSVGGNHSIAIDSEGMLWGWGLNDRGQLGYKGAEVQYNSPIDIGNIDTNLPQFVDSTSGFNHTLFLHSDGTIWSSGRNNFGQLGIGSNKTTIYTATKISTVSNIKSINCGYYHSVVLDSSGYVWVAGRNIYGQLGLGNKSSVKSFTKLNSLSGVKDIDVGNHHSLALLSNGELWGWGDNYSGQLMGNEHIEYLSPVKLNIENIKLFSGGEGHSVAIKNDGSIWSWGGNNYGELGIGTTISSTIPIPVITYSPLDNIKKLENGTNHNIALNSLGDIYSWGKNNKGQLFNGKTIDKVNPIYVDVNIVRDDIYKVFRGNGRVYYITNQLQILGSGKNNYGQLGDGTIGNKNNFRNILEVENIKDIQPSLNFTTFLNDSGDVYVSGLLTPNGELEENDYITIPRKIKNYLDWNSMTLFPLESVSKIVGSYHNNAVITIDGGLFLGGDNTYTQKGGLSSSTDILSLHKVPYVKGEFDDIKDISCGTSFSMLLKSDGDVYITGINNYGQLGVGIENDPLLIEYPIKIEELSNVKSIGATEGGCIALKSDGQVWTWGRQSYGELGDGTVPDTILVNGTRILNTDHINPTPSNNVTSNDYSKVKTGLRHSMFIKSDGTVWGTGYNYYGQLGIGSILDASTPIQVNITSVSDVACGGEFTIFLKSDGTVWGVGRDNYLGKGGTLGRGSGNILNASLPVQIPSLSSIKYINSGLNSSVAIRSDGKVYTWGLNESGQLGHGIDPISSIGLGDNYEYFTTPTYVNTYGYTYNIHAGNVSKVYGNNSTFFMKTFDGDIYGWGYNSYYKLIQTSNTNYYINEPTLSTLSNIDEIFVGPEWCFSKDSNGNIETWGINTYGQLGLNSTGGSYDSPQSVNISNVKDIYAYSNETLLLKNDGTVWACGRVGSNIGLNGNNINVFTKVDNLSDIIKISRGDKRSVFLKSDGTVLVCGTNTNGVLGLPLDINIVNVPVVVEGLTDVTDIACYKNCILCIKSDGTMVGVGTNNYIFNGNGVYSSPKEIEYITDASIFAKGNGNNTVIYRTNTNITKGFGYTGNLIFGIEDDEHIVEPKILIEVAFSSQNIFIISKDTLVYNRFGTVFTIGYNEFGVLGRSFDPEQIEYSYIYEQIRSKQLLYDQAKNVEVSKDGMYCLSSEGTITFWGNNLNYDTLDERYILTPTDVTEYNINPIISIHTPKNDFQWSMVIDINNNSYAKGYNNYGNLGNLLSGFYNAEHMYETEYNNNLIKHITSFNSGVKDVKIGDGYYIFLTSNGDVYSIGRNNNYQLGNGDNKNTDVPINIASGVRELVSTNGYITETGILYKWGDNTFGQIGNGSLDVISSPINILTSVREAYGEDNYTYAFKDNNDILVWGDNSKGQLGLGDFDNRDVPTMLNVAISGGFIDWEFNFNRIVAFKNDDMWAWGDNTYGQLGDGSNTNRNIPTYINEFIGREHIILDDSTISMQISGGRVSSWGNNDYGQLTNKTILSENTPIALRDNQRVIDISIGLDFSLLLKENGLVYGAGVNNKGQLGSPINTYANFLQLLPFTNVETIESGRSHSFVITSNGTVYGFGDNTYNQIIDVFGDEIYEPVEIISLSNIQSIKGGDGHTMAIADNGDLYGWGRNDYGQLGDNTLTDKNIPVLVLEDVKEITIGVHHNVALTTNGVVYTWGKNDSGQVGNGTLDNVSTPVAIASNVKIIDTGDNFTIIQKSDNTIWGWGLNNNYQMGNYSVTTNYSIPVQIFNSDYEYIQFITSGESDVIYSVNGSLKIWGNNDANSRDVTILLQAQDGKEIRANGKQTGLLKNTGELYMWGDNSKGQLGDGTIMNRSEPKNVMSYVDKLYMGQGHTMVLRNDKFLWAFGDNYYGQLGDGTYTSRSNPIFINALNKIVSEFSGT